MSKVSEVRDSEWEPKYVPGTCAPENLLDGWHCVDALFRASDEAALGRCRDSGPRGRRAKDD